MNNAGRKVLSVVAAGSMLLLGGCANVDSTGAPARQQVSSVFSRINESCYYQIEGQQAVKMFNTDNVYLMYDKYTYEVTEVLHSSAYTKNGVKLGEILYDFDGEILSVYYDGDPDYTQNYGYRSYLFNNNYVIPLGDAAHYIDGGLDMKDSYSLAEIRALEPQIKEGLIIIDRGRAKSYGTME